MTRSLRPSYRLLQCLLALMLWALLLAALRLMDAPGAALQWLELLFNAAIGLLLLATLWDVRPRPELNAIQITRQLSTSLALGVRSPVQLRLHNPLNIALQLSLQEQNPDTIECLGLPVTFKLAALSRHTLDYTVIPRQRGNAHFGPCLLRLNSRWGLWQSVITAGPTNEVKVYPNFAPIARLAHLGIEQSIEQLGIHPRQRRGEGLDFRQLREFREGDALRQIDWKATARQRKPISRDYQDERDQDIIFLLDCGRRMRSKDDQLSHFDHALNALLLTAYIALRQGDAVGLVSFAGASRRLSPRKGQASINLLLNQLYDLHSSTDSSDYSQAAQQLLAHHSKRALVILITNVRDEDDEDLIAASALLRKKHRLVIANLRENFVDNTLAKTVDDFSDAMEYCGANSFVEQRQSLLNTLRAAKVNIVDSMPQQLHLDLVRQYLAIKRSGLL